mmetsp:Transcript_55347/g.157271  ORF Transcript_55347/g.157271 Transcript_55347/m.157271 type:complete len:293 (-) Transcript_55347:67-945(-)
MSWRCLPKIALGVVLLIFVFEWLVYHVFSKPEPGWAALFNAVLALALWSYLAAALTDPGTPRCAEWEEWRLAHAKALGSIKEAKDEAEAARAWAPGEARWCKDCGCKRPERAHHCRQCGVCVLRMDHHCPWIGTCVGWRNHKFFLLFNWWTFWACLAFLVTLRQPNAMVAVGEMVEGGPGPRMLPAFGVLVAFLFILVTGGMFCSSLAMAGQNVTAVEELYSGDNPYRLSSCLDNVRQLLGPPDWRLALPLAPERRSRGTSFPVASQPAVAQEAGLAVTAVADTVATRYGSA